MDLSLTRLSTARWDDLTEPQPENTKTYLERHFPNVGLELSDWIDDGILRLDFSKDEEFMALIDDYIAERSQLPKDRLAPNNFWHGWHFPTSYLMSPAMMNLGLCRQLSQFLSKLFNESPLLHLALTGWVSTERNWHQDSYLNPPSVWSGYAAAWIALDDIDVMSGPFEYVPGSHRWDVLRREKLFGFLDDQIRSNPDWPSITQAHVARVCEKKIMAMDAQRKYFVPKKGEVLLWHSNLIHRGTKPRNPDLLRKALILHYSGFSRRVDMEPKVRYGYGFYFNGPTDGSVRMK